METTNTTTVATAPLVTLDESRNRLLVELRTGTPASFRQAQTDFVDRLVETFADVDLMPGTSDRIADVIPRIEELLLVWNPTGFRLADLTRLLGHPSGTEDDTLVYEYDAGYDTLTLRIHTEGDNVTGVNATDGE